MHTRWRRTWLAAALVASWLVATPTTAADVPMLSASGATYDDVLVAVAESVPGFAGAWLDGGSLVVRLVHAREGAVAAADGIVARRALAGALGRPEIAAMLVVVRSAAFSFRELKRWHDAVSREALALPGAVSSDVDETSNVVRIGTTDVAGTEARVRAIAEANGVPQRAVVVEHADPVVDQLRDRNLPVAGGVEISWIGPKEAALYQCTLGFNAIRAGVLGYVTNSHCTLKRASVDSGVHQQPLGGQPIGVEIADPAHLAGGACPVGRYCRYSDSSFHSLRVDAFYDHGRIARPPEGGIAWNGVDTFRITAEATPLAGETVTKVGRTTGRTSGAVRSTCKTFNVQSANLTMLCQGQADYFSSSGDSGSPVVAVTSGDDVTLKGINWGSGGVFSPIDGVQRDSDLGPLTTCAAGFSC
ncbi:MAG TPA: hypothetical protein VF230_15200 [Acidimicrobiales bacterium]